VKELEFDPADFELHFAVKLKEGAEDPAKKAALATKATAVRVLDAKRSNAIAIMCSKLPDSDTLIQAIRNLDSAVLEKHLVRSLCQNLATAEEMQTIREALKLQPDIQFDKPEKFCLLMSEIPELKRRLQCWEFTLTFDERVLDIGPPIIAVQRAGREIAKSKALKVFLGAVLGMGNYLNGGHNKRGQADGFQVDALTKLHDLKDTFNKSTLLDYIFSTYKDLYPELLRLPDEIPTSASATRVVLKEVAGELRKLLVETKDMKTACSHIAAATDQEDPFLATVPKYMESAVEKLSNIRADLLVAEKVFEELVKYFSSTEDATEVFFGYFATLGQVSRNSITKMQQAKKVAGKKVGDGGEDAMGGIIASIKAGKARKAVETTTGAGAPAGEGAVAQP
jgi:diaphanous 2